MGPALTYDLCGQNVRVKVKVKIKCGFDFNILTAFIRLGRARPVRGGVPSIFIIIGIVPSILLSFDFVAYIILSYYRQ